MPLHPQIVHFPIAFLLLAALVELSNLYLNRRPVSRFALVLLIIGTIGAFAAVQSGENSEDKVEQVLPETRNLLEEHEEAGNRVMWFFIAVSVLKIVLTALKIEALPWRIVLSLLLLIGAFLLYRAGHYGGQLVYEYGAGVRPVMEKTLPASDVGDSGEESHELKN